MPTKRKDNKGRVLKDGESQRKDGLYQYRYTDYYGKRQCVYAKDLDTLRYKESAIEADKRDGIGGDLSQMTVSQLVASHIQRKKKLRARTISNYYAKLKYIERYSIASVLTCQVKRNDIIDLLEQMCEDGIAYSSVEGTKALLFASFQDAVDNDAIRKNPVCFRLTDYIENDSKKIMALTKEEISSLMTFLQNNIQYKKYTDLFIVMLGTGLRAGEMCGLTLSCIDFKENCIRVEKQLSRINGELVVSPLKTQKSYRTIPMTKDVRNSMEQMVAVRQHMKGITEHIVDGQKGFLLVTKTGKPMTPTELALLFRRISHAYTDTTRKSIHLTPHVMRHTFCTMLSNERLSTKTIQYLMGHSTLAMLKVYDDAQYDVVYEEFTRRKSIV